MSVIKFLLSKSGFSMTELMVGVGLLGGVSLVTMKLMQNQAQNESNLKYSAAVNRAALLVQTMMNNNQRCNEMMVGRTRNTGSAFSLQVAMTGGGTQVMLAPDTEYSEGFYIPADGIQLVTSSMGTGVTDLVLTFKTRSLAMAKRQTVIKTSTNASTITKRIPFVTELTGDVIKSCGPVLSDSDVTAKKMMCDSLGAGAATWDNTTKTCLLREMKCPAGMVPYQITSLGGMKCQNVTDPSVRDQFFDYSASTCSPGQGVTLGAGADGKIKATCTGVATGCPATTLSWTVGEKAFCSGAVSAGAWGATVAATSVAPYAGTATFLCNSGTKTWALQTTPAPTCQNTVLQCPVQTVTWSGKTKFCKFTSASVYSQGQKATFTDSSALGGSDGTGSAVFECNNGVLGQVGTGTCCTTPGACTD